MYYMLLLFTTVISTFPLKNVGLTMVFPLHEHGLTGTMWLGGRAKATWTEMFAKAQPPVEKKN